MSLATQRIIRKVLREQQRTDMTAEEIATETGIPAYIVRRELHQMRSPTPKPRRAGVAEREVCEHGMRPEAECPLCEAIRDYDRTR